MTKILVKYSIILVVAKIIASLLTVSIMTIWPLLLTTETPNRGTFTLGTGFLETGIEYLINLVIIYLLVKEMEKEDFFSLPILILTFFSNWIGILFFFLAFAYKSINYKQLY